MQQLPVKTCLAVTAKETWDWGCCSTLDKDPTKTVPRLLLPSRSSPSEEKQAVGWIQKRRESAKDIEFLGRMCNCCCTGDLGVMVLVLLLLVLVVVMV